MNQADFELGGTMGGQTGEQAKTADLIPHGTKVVATLTGAKKNMKQREGAANGVMNVTTTMTFTIQEPENYKGRVIRHTIGNDHPSDQYMAMSRSYVAKLQIALGLGSQVLTSLFPLTNKPVLATVTQTSGKKAGTEPQNDIGDFAPAANLVGSMPPAGPAPVQAAPMPQMQQAPAFNPVTANAMSAPPAMPASTLAGGPPPWKQ